MEIRPLIVGTEAQSKTTPGINMIVMITIGGIRAETLQTNRIQTIAMSRTTTRTTPTTKAIRIATSALVPTEPVEVTG